MILGIDTAGAALGIALAHDGTVIVSFTVHRKNAHDELLIPLIEQALLAAGTSVSALEAVAVASGPGSFTGLRIGMAAVKGMALAAGSPVVCVPTLDAMAHHAATTHPTDTFPLGAVLDARKDDVYAAVYDICAGSFSPRSTVVVCTAAEAAAMLPEGARLCGDGAAKIIASASGRILPESRLDFVSLAEDVALLGARMASRGDFSDAASCEPLYVRDFRTTKPKSIA